MITSHIRSRSELFFTFMKALSNCIAEIATIDESNFSLRPVKSIFDKVKAA